MPGGSRQTDAVVLLSRTANPKLVECIQVARTVMLPQVNAGSITGRIVGAILKGNNSSRVENRYTDERLTFGPTLRETL